MKYCLNKERKTEQQHLHGIGQEDHVSRLTRRSVGSNPMSPMESQQSAGCQSLHSSIHSITSVQCADLHKSLTQQLSSVLAMLRIARKMHVTIPENSRMAIHSLSGSTAAAAASTSQTAAAEQFSSAQKPSDGPFPRRYSKAQGEAEVEDTFNTEEILHRFNNSMVLHKPNRFNLYESSASDDEYAKSSSSPFSSRLLTRRMSASDITKMDTSRLASLAASSSAGDSSSSDADPSQGGVLSRYLGRRRGSAGNILAAMSGALIPSSAAQQVQGDSSLANNSSALVPANASTATATTPSPPPTMPTSLDTVDSAVPSGAGSSSFGFFSKTRQFGAWLTKATEGEKVEVSRPDLNAVAPTSF